MKKYLFILVLLANLILVPNKSFGILSDPMGLDMYKKVDKGLYDLELKYLERELKGGDSAGSIVEDLKKRFRANNLRDDCIKSDLSVGDVEKIRNGNEDVQLFGKISEDCFGKEGAMPSSYVAEYINVIRESYYENLKKAQNKVKQTYQIGRIGMYSDGIEENSPFDLMIDLDEIDRIIFEQNIPYNGVNTENLGNVVDSVLKGLNPNLAFNLNRYKDNIIFQGKYKTNTDFNSEKKYNNGNNEICPTNNSGLSEDSLEKILGGKNIGNSDSGLKNSGTSDSPRGIFDLTGSEKSFSGSGYSKVNDNPIFPCNEFFCIIIKFVTYKHNLLGGGKNLSIEGLIKRSNEHLKKFVSTSLIQANMTINFFQLGLKDLNLPDIFHVGVQVSYKPVPIINVERDGKDKESDEFKYKNLLTRYYKNLGLDYERANDLDIFKQLEPRLKSVLDGTEMPQTKAEEKENSFYSYLDKIKKENDYVSNTIIDKKVIEEDMNNFYKQFAELESFTNALLDYVIGIGGIIRKMEEIPKKG